ncbi:hypothetical protein [Streptomyces sp. ISL-94]|uniref:hypothetical protein n=1 Tax=Streptomyces sp. ISL-94 TaxID=2819190 RepID=UPI0035AF6001
MRPRLQRAEDFPAGAPVLVITDGRCDTLRIRREHAYPVPQGASLPFTPEGPGLPTGLRASTV